MHEWFQDVPFIQRGYAEEDFPALRLFEDLHYAAFPYNDSLYIIAHIVDYLFRNHNKQNFTIVASKLDDYPLEIGDNTVYVHIIYTEKEGPDFRASYAIDVNKKMHINVYMHPNLKDLNVGLLKEYLDHEVLHAIRDKGRSDKNLSSEYESVIKNVRINDKSYKDELAKNVNRGLCCPEYMVYRLATDTEYWALVNQIPQGLQNIGSKKRDKFIDDVKNTFAYKEYHTMQEYLAEMRESDDWVGKIKRLFVRFDNKSDEAFKKFFLKYCEDRLERMWFDMCKIASGYYLVNSAKAGEWTDYQKRMMNLDKNDKLGSNLKTAITFNPYDVTEKFTCRVFYSKDNNPSMIDSQIILGITYNSFNHNIDIVEMNF